MWLHNAAERHSIVENKFEMIGLTGEVKNKMSASAATAHDAAVGWPARLSGEAAAFWYQSRPCVISPALKSMKLSSGLR